MDSTEIFEEQRRHLRAVAYRLLGSVHEADDAVQETWLRLQRSDVAEVDNLPGWLTTVVSRICLDQLRSRTARREDLGAELASPGANPLRDEQVTITVLTPTGQERVAMGANLMDHGRRTRVLDTALAVGARASTGDAS